MSRLRNKTGLAAAVGLTSVSIIAFQLVMMQVLSVSQWHHFAHMVISTALLGFGAAGTILAVFRGFFRRNYTTVLPALFALCGITMSVSVTVTGAVGTFDAFLLFFERSQYGFLLFFYLIYFLPFFLGGLALTLVFYVEVESIGRFYFANMTGSGIGAVLILLLMWVLPVEYLPAILGLLPVWAAYLTRPHSRAFSIFIAASVLISAVLLIRPSAPQPSEYKPITGALQLPGAERVHVSSSPYGLLEIVRADALRYAPALSLTFRDSPPVWDVMFSNGEYFGSLPVNYDLGKPFVLDYTTRVLPYLMRDVNDVLVLRATTGDDVVHALANGARHVTAVEPNRQALNLLKRHHPEWNDSLYLRPDVKTIGGNIRTYLERSRETYDLIKLPVMDTFGGSAGVYALEEQYHLTLEAFTRMWNMLSEDGMITATTWLDYPLRYALRIPLTWRMLLEETGVDAPEAHITAVRSWGAITFVLSKSPVKEHVAALIRDKCRKLNFDPLILIDLHENERAYYNAVEDEALFGYMDDIMAGNWHQLLDEYPFNLAPVTDNQPFFSHFLQWGSINYIRDLYGGGTLPYMEIGFILAVVTFVQIVIISILLIIVPLLKSGWSGTRRRWTLLYFVGTGIGFMFFEIVMIQKMILYLGLPVYAAAAVLAILLIGSGFGSLFSSRLYPAPDIMTMTGGIISVLIILYLFFLSPLIQFSIGWSIWLRLLVIVVMLGLPAFFMGMMFPLGLRRLSGGHHSQIPWACGVDSFMSVTAASLALLVALDAGFKVVLIISCAAYLLAAISGRKMGV